MVSRSRAKNVARRRTQWRLACLQVGAGPDWECNFSKVMQKVRQALSRQVDVVALPEMFLWRGRLGAMRKLSREVTPEVLECFCRLARRSRTAFLLGSLVEKSREPDRFYNTSFLISEQGRIAARYRKIHLFDVRIQNKVNLRESRHMIHGSKVVSGKIFGVRVGLTVCYDLRFPELFRCLTREGCRLIFVPANFTHQTGKAHWETLLRARAIENQVFIAAPAQVGVHPIQGIRSYGNSLVVDPWGRVIARATAHREEILTASLDWDYQQALRKSFPVLRHQRLMS